jgi:hypothetical protein
MTGPLDFLSRPPTPVRAVGGEAIERSFSADVLPQSLADSLLRLDGVVGVWLERDPDGKPEVILHTSRLTDLQHLPARVEGMAVRLVGGDPIRAQH